MEIESELKVLQYNLILHPINRRSDRNGWADFSTDAAKKRVAYALEKLRKYVSKYGVTSTTATLAGAISANSVQAAPTMLAKL